MQAVRQCSVCAHRAAGGLLRSQSEMSLLQTNKSLFRRGEPNVRFLSISESRALGALKLDALKTTKHSSAVSSSDPQGLFDLPFPQQVGNLSHDSVIRRAASMVTDSSSTFLSQTTLALTEALTVYSKAVHSRIAFQRRYLATLGELTPAEENTLLQVVHGWRAEASERLEDCKRYESTWITAVNLCKTAAETADNSGAQQASVTLKTMLQVAQFHVEEAQKLSADADKKLAETKVEEIQRMAEYTSSLENIDEHEIHEAYLRED